MKLIIISFVNILYITPTKGHPADFVCIESSIPHRPLGVQDGKCLLLILQGSNDNGKPVKFCLQGLGAILVFCLIVIGPAAQGVPELSSNITVNSKNVG